MEVPGVFSVKKNHVRLLFLLIFPFLFLQLFIGKKFSEPYPSFIFPSFAKVPDAEFRFDKPECWAYFADGDSSAVDINELFRPMPVFLHERILRNKMKTQTVFSEHTEQQRDQLKEYLKERTAGMFDRTDIKAFKVKWYDYVRNVDNQIIRSYDKSFAVNLQ